MGDYTVGVAVPAVNRMPSGSGGSTPSFPTKEGRALVRYTVLKTAGCESLGGSNPSPSATIGSQEARRRIATPDTLVRIQSDRPYATVAQRQRHEA